MKTWFFWIEHLTELKRFAYKWDYTAAFFSGTRLCYANFFLLLQLETFHPFFIQFKVRQWNQKKRSTFKRIDLISIHGWAIHNEQNHSSYYMGHCFLFNGQYVLNVHIIIKHLYTSFILTYWSPKCTLTLLNIIMVFIIEWMLGKLL